MGVGGIAREILRLDHGMHRSNSVAPYILQRRIEFKGLPGFRDFTGAATRVFERREGLLLEVAAFSARRALESVKLTMLNHRAQRVAHAANGDGSLGGLRLCSSRGTVQLPLFQAQQGDERRGVRQR